MASSNEVTLDFIAIVGKIPKHALIQDVDSHYVVLSYPNIGYVAFWISAFGIGILMIHVLK